MKKNTAHKSSSVRKMLGDKSYLRMLNSIRACNGLTDEVLSEINVLDLMDELSRVEAQRDALAEALKSIHDADILIYGVAGWSPSSGIAEWFGALPEVDDAMSDSGQSLSSKNDICGSDYEFEEIVSDLYVIYSVREGEVTCEGKTYALRTQPYLSKNDVSPNDGHSVWVASAIDAGGSSFMVKWDAPDDDMSLCLTFASRWGTATSVESMTTLMDEI